MFPEPAPSDERISDAERDRFVAVLRLHCTEGRITLDEFSDRVGDVYAARTRAQLDTVVADLPVPWDDPAPAARGFDEVSRPRRSVRWVVAVFGNSRRRGRFRIDDESAAIAVFGDCTLDLSEALIDSREVAVSAVAVFGNVTVIVPEGIDVDFGGIAVFGDKRLDIDGGHALPGSPTVVVRAFACFGDVRVRTPRDGGKRRRFARP